MAPQTFLFILLLPVSLHPVAPPGGKMGKFPPPLLFWAVFPVRANPLRKIFRGYTPPDPPKLLSVRCSTNETSRENVVFDL